MSHLRVRALDKPIALHSLPYNRCSQNSEASSEPSFLKLSEKNSEQLAPLLENNIFSQMQERLNRMEANSINNIHKIQAKIMAHDATDKRRTKCSGKVMMDRVEAQMTYRLQQSFEEGPEECIFEMDQNRNYVRRSEDSIPKIAQGLVEVKEILSEPHRRLSSTLRQNMQKSSKSNSRRSSLCGRSQASRENQAKAGLSRSTAKRKDQSSCKSSRGAPIGVYQQILSNYSTAKLLAMQKCGSDR